MSEGWKGAFFGGFVFAIAWISSLGWIASLNDNLMAEKCRDFGKFKVDGVVYECRPVQSDHVGEGA